MNATLQLLANGTEILLDPSGKRGRGGGVLSVPEDQKTDGLQSTDAAWVLMATFMIFTMQSGFGLLESGTVSCKNETNIMIKNIADVVLGGFTYWLFGYALSFGQSEWTNPFCGWGSFALNPSEDEMGEVYTTFFFQLSFATTATTIVSGAVAERFNFMAYAIFSALNTLVYCIPAGWIWGHHGFLYKMGVIDIAGSCGVHLCGGASAFAAAYLVGPRLGRYDFGEAPLPMGSPTTALLGTLMLWWGWLAFNSGSTFGINHQLWKYAAAASVMTLISSIGGGIAGMGYSYIVNKRRLDVGDVMNSILGSLVSITAGCALFKTWEALIIGFIGGLIAVVVTPLFNKIRIDDPVSAITVHGVSGVWGMVAIGLFVSADKTVGLTGGRSGLFKGGGFELLAIQLLACIVTAAWAGGLTFIILKLLNLVVPIRMSEWEELMGADFAEHGLRRPWVGISRAASVIGLNHGGHDYDGIPNCGINPGHENYVKEIKEGNRRTTSSERNWLSRLRDKIGSKQCDITMNGLHKVEGIDNPCTIRL